MSAPSDEEWERIYLVHNFWDCPRTGVADFHGKPHAFSATFDHEADDYSDIYELSPISEAQLALVSEAFEIEERWGEAFQSNSLGPEDQPPQLASDWARYEKLRPLVDQAVAIDPQKMMRAIPAFRLDPSKARRAHSYGLQVRWSVVP